jgi:polyisoprenoid-binding protein YceI
MKSSLSTLLVMLLFTSLLVSAETKYKIDPSHTSIDFSVSHMVISSVTGKFKEVSGSLTAKGDDFTDARIDVFIPAKSINTENEKRDEHLRSADFFDVAKFPEVTFKSVSVKKTGDNAYIISGDLTMHGVTKSVDLKTTFKGSVKSPWGQTVVAFKGTTVIARKEWGLSWNKAMEAGGVLVGEDVELTLNVELVKE